jgi:hypothetical protein
MQTAINRQADVLRGKRGLRPGPIAALVKQECTLELFSVGKGSPAAVMSFAGPEPQQRSKQRDLDLEIRKLGEAAVHDVVAYVESVRTDPHAAIDPGVRRSLQEMGALLKNGLKSIELSAPALNGRHRRIKAVIDQDTLKRINEPAHRGHTKPVQLDGRLEMADFKRDDLKCIIHTSDDRRVVCSFQPELGNDVYNALRHIARVHGIGTINPKTKRPEHIELSSVAVLDPFLGHTHDFVSGLGIADLAKAQGVDPTADLRTIGAAWPDDEDLDKFLAGVYERRSQPV